ncbi:MAG TPA: protein kinase [Pyrinomonadaceae bacterium]|nr:protein kinase [Pyrinomonadaceae bacterium]
MSNEKWQQLKEIFEDALRHEAAERQQFLDKACGDDEELQREVESLLASFEDSFLEKSAVGEVADVIVLKSAKQFKKNQTVGHYKIISKLGKGGQGAVYKAHDSKLNRTVALKILPPELSSDESSRKRFEREARLASSLDHQNICTIHDLTEIEGNHFIVMQFVEGKNIRQLVNGKPLEIKSALKIAIQVCDALANAHNENIIHRDIKAHNIIVTDKGIAKILDFGLAKLTDKNSEEQTELTALGSPYGTPTYAAPEQSRGEKVDYRADVFSTGVLLYEMLTGTWAFHGKTAVDVRHAVLHDKPKPIAERRGEEIPKKLQAIVDKALQKEPQNRFQQIGKMRDELIEVLRELPAGEQSETARFLDNFKPLAPRHLWNFSNKAKLISAISALIVLTLIGFGIYRLTQTKTVNKSIQTIAVLPFKPLSANGDEFLELGMADSLITRLSNLKQLTVRPTSAVLKYAKTQDAISAGKELNVDAVLDGRIQREGDKLRITVQLIRVGNGEVLWFGKFDEDFKSIFAVQDSISERLVSELAMKLTQEEKQILTKRYTENTVAYQSYLKGRYFWNKWSGENSAKAIENFELALKADSAYAPAYAGLADAYELQGYLGIKPPNEVYPKAKSAVEKALALDENLGEAHLVSAKIKLFYDWDLPGAEKEISRALSLIPNSADAHGFYGVYLVVMGKLDDALAERKKMQELDPINAFATVNVGWSYAYKRDYDSAIAQFKKALELDPNFSTAQIALGEAYLRKGMFAEAVEAFLKEKSISGAMAETIADYRKAFASGGITGYWQKELEKAKERGSPRRLARIYMELGDKDQAFAWLEKAFDERSSLLVFLKTDPIFDALRNDVRYEDLMRRVGLTK